MIDRALLARTAELAADHLDAVGERHAGPLAGFPELRAALGGALPEAGVPAAEVIEALARDAAPGLVASPGPRYFGFVTGGALPAALAADWLASAWDQNAFSAVSSPAAAVVEEVACGWLLELLGLPAESGVGLTTGAQMANVTGLAAARHAAARAGGLGSRGAGPERSATAARPGGRGGARHRLARACGCSGFGRAAVEVVPVDGQGAMRADALASALAAGGGEAIVVRAGGQREHGRDRPARPTSSPPPASTTPGSTSTAPSGCGPRRARRWRASWPAWATPTPGPPTATSGSTSPTTAASSPSATAPPTSPRWG